jgi:hypothetical protein
METVNIQSHHISEVASTFMSATSPLNVVATFRSAVINLAMSDEKMSCRITPRSTRCLIASVDFEGNPSDEAVSDGEVAETQPYLERIATDTKELDEE